MAPTMSAGIPSPAIENSGTVCGCFSTVMVGIVVGIGVAVAGA